MKGLTRVSLFSSGLTEQQVKDIVELLRINPNDRTALNAYLRGKGAGTGTGCEFHINHYIIDYVTRVMWRLEQYGISVISSAVMSFSSVAAEQQTSQRKEINIARLFESHESYNGSILRSDLPLMDSHENGRARVIVIPVHSFIVPQDDSDNDSDSDSDEGVESSPVGHWSLLVYYTGFNKLYHYDSIPGIHRDRVSDILDIYNRPNVMATINHGGSPPLFTSRRILTLENDVIEPTGVPVQNGSWECGLYSLFIIKAIQERAKMGIYEPLVELQDMKMLLLNDTRTAVKKHILRFRKSIALSMELDARYSAQVQKSIMKNDDNLLCQSLKDVVLKKNVSETLLIHLLLRMSSAKILYSHKITAKAERNVHCSVYSNMTAFSKSSSVMSIMFLRREEWTALLVKHTSRHYFLYDPTGGYLDDSGSVSRESLMKRLNIKDLTVYSPEVPISKRTLLPSMLNRRMSQTLISQLACLALAIRTVNSGMPMRGTTFWETFLTSVFSTEGVSHGASMAVTLSRNVIDTLVHDEILLRHTPVYIYRSNDATGQWLSLSHPIPRGKQVETLHMARNQWSATSDSERVILPLAALLYRFKKNADVSPSMCMRTSNDVTRRRIAAINTDLFPYNRFSPRQFEGDAHILNWFDWQQEHIFLEESAPSEIPYWFVPKVATSNDFTTPETLAAINVSKESIIGMLHPDGERATYLVPTTGIRELDTLVSPWGYVDVAHKWKEHFARGPMHWRNEEKRTRLSILKNLIEIRAGKNDTILLSNIFEILAHTPHWLAKRNMSMIDFKNGEEFDQEVKRIVTNFTGDTSKELSDIFVKELILFPMLLSHNTGGKSQHDQPYGQLPSDRISLFNPMSTAHARILAEGTVTVSDEISTKDGWLSRVSDPIRTDWIEHSTISPIYHALWIAPQDKEVSSDEFRLLAIYINEALRSLTLNEVSPLDHSLEKALSHSSNLTSVNALYEAAAAYGV